MKLSHVFKGIGILALITGTACTLANHFDLAAVAWAVAATMFVIALDMKIDERERPG